jgi:hypothetical protein
MRLADAEDTDQRSCARVWATGGGDDSWPLTAFGSIIYRSATMEDCSKAHALASFLYWTQTSAQSQQIARR